MFPQWFKKKKFLDSSLSFFPLPKCNSSLYIIKMSCLKVTMLTLSGLNNRDIIYMKGTGLQGWPSDIPMPRSKALVFFIFLLAVHRRSLSFPHSFRMAVAIPTAMPRKTFWGRKRVFSSVCLHFYKWEELSQQWPWLPNFYSGFFAFLLLRLKFST